MKTLLRHSKVLPVLAVSAIAFHRKEEIAQSLFGSSTTSNKDQKTRTYIWGNGLYISGGSMTFSNFEPKLIKNFDGVNGPSMQ